MARTGGGRVPGVVPVDGGVGAGQHAGAEALADELQDLGAEAVAGGVLGEAPGGGAPREDRLGKPQPFRHHGVHAVAPNQNLSNIKSIDRVSCKSL